MKREDLQFFCSNCNIAFDEYLQVTRPLWEGLKEAMTNDQQLEGISLT